MSRSDQGGGSPQPRAWHWPIRGLSLQWRLGCGLMMLGGFPKLQVNVPVYDSVTGLHLGRPDLLDAEAGLAIEYDGSGHRQMDRHRTDNAREHRLESAGLIVVRFDGHDVFVTPGHTLRTAHGARQRGLARDRSCDQWTCSSVPWWIEDE